MKVVQLPISHMQVVLRPLTGYEDVLLLEDAVSDTALAIELLTRIASSYSGTGVAWNMLCVSDLDALLLLLRQSLFGDLIHTDISCSGPGCEQRIDVRFSIHEYLAHHRPRVARGVVATQEEGWFRLKDTEVMFRLPTAADQVAVALSPAPEVALIERCVQPAELAARQLRRVENALEALAPGLSHILQGKCLECGTMIDMYFDVQRFCLQELRHQATFVYEDVHLLATHYHWPLSEILALPRHQRVLYINQIQRERSPI